MELSVGTDVSISWLQIAYDHCTSSNTYIFNIWCWLCSTNHDKGYDNIGWWWWWWWYTLRVRVFLPKVTVAHLVKHASLCTESRFRYRVYRGSPLIHVIIPTYEYKTVGLWVKSQHGTKGKDKRTPYAFMQLHVVCAAVFRVHSFDFLLCYSVFMERVS
jgi:hypothetical protein